MFDYQGLYPLGSPLVQVRTFYTSANLPTIGTVIHGLQGILWPCTLEGYI